MTNNWRRPLSELRLAVRDNLDEATAAFWSDAQLNRFLSRSAHTIWAEVRKVKADYFLINRASTDGSVNIFGEAYATNLFQIIPGTREYTLPPDLVELKRIDTITSNYEYIQWFYRDLAHPDMRYLRTVTDNQTPSGFLFDIIGERTLAIEPKSDTTLDIRIWYVPTTVINSSAGASQMDFSADTDQLIMPHPLYMAVEELATWRAQYMDRDPGSDRWQDMANKTVARWMGAHRRQTQDPEIVMGVFE